MGDVTGTAIIEYGEWTGGLVGYNLGAITNCWATATVVSEGDNVGGLVGENLTEGIITESYSSGDVTAGDYTGGLVGSNMAKSRLAIPYTVSGDRDVGLRATATMKLSPAVIGIKIRQVKAHQPAAQARPQWK